MRARVFAAASIVVALAAIRPLYATTYTPLTFAELVAGADVIFVGEVVDARPYVLRTPRGPVIKTRVTFRVDDAIYGTRSLVEVFDVVGGEIGGVGMAVAAMPKFAVGDHRVVFARRDRSINPIVGFRQGLLDVERDGSGVERVLTLDRVPVSGPEMFGTAGRVAAAPGNAMRLADFRARIAAQLAAVHRQ